jgi:hypothetical protein
MESLLHEEKGVAIIAVQEPWLNRGSGTYCPSSAAYIPVCEGEQRSCLLINKAIKRESWEHKTWNRDLYSVKLITSLGIVWIHSVYSQPPGDLRNINYEYPFELLRAALGADGEHIVVGDFNLHHPLWSKPWYPPHDRADELLEIT